MLVDPKIEDPMRTMIGHVVRQEYDGLENEIRRIGNDTFLSAISPDWPQQLTSALDAFRNPRWPRRFLNKPRPASSTARTRAPS